jgi:hypothetical protein
LLVLFLVVVVVVVRSGSSGGPTTSRWLLLTLSGGSFSRRAVKDLSDLGLLFILVGQSDLLEASDLFK